MNSAEGKIEMRCWSIVIPAAIHAGKVMVPVNGTVKAERKLDTTECFKMERGGNAAWLINAAGYLFFL